MVVKNGSWDGQTSNGKWKGLFSSIRSAEAGPNWYTFLNSLMPLLVPCLRMTLVISRMYGSIALWGYVAGKFLAFKALNNVIVNS